MSGINYPKLRKAWERTCKFNPALAEQIGPPNWLVKERMKPKEEFLAAALRVKSEDLK